MRLPKQCSDVSRPLAADAHIAGDLAPAGILGILGTITKVAAPIVRSFL